MQREGDKPLSDRVEMDDGYLGEVRNRYQQDPVFKQIGNLVFWALAVIVVLHIEGFPDENGKRIIYALTSVLSILLICIVRVRIAHGLGTAGIVFAASIMSYLIIGLIVAIYQGIELSVSDYKNAGATIFFLLIFVASALGGFVTIRTYGVETTFSWILRIFIVICAVIITSPILISFGLPLVQHHGPRHSGPYIDPNNAGIVGCLTVTMAITFLRFSKYRISAYLALYTGLIAILFTGSKTAIIASFSVVSFFLLFRNRRINIFFPLLSLVVLFIIYSGEIVTLLSWQHLDRLSAILTLVYGNIGNPDHLLTGRELLWNLAIEQAMESPIFGHGFSQGIYLEEGSPYVGTNKRLGVHNIYLLLIVEAGIIPILLYLLYLFSIFRLFLSVPVSPAKDTVIGWTIVLILAGITFHHLFTLKVLAFVIGLSCATGQFLNASQSGRG